MEIIKFKFKGYFYSILYNDGKFEYLKKDNKNNNIEMSEEDNKIVKEVLNKINISNKEEDYIKCGKILYNGEIYQTYYDKKTGIKYLSIISEKSNNKLSLNDYIKIDAILNPIVYYNDPEKTEDKKNKKEKTNTIIRNVVIGGMAVSILISGIYIDMIYGLFDKNIVLHDGKPAIVQINNNNNLSVIPQETYEYIEMDKFIIEYKEHLNQNNRITKEEKQLMIKKGTEIIKDNEKYITKSVAKQIIDRIDRLKIVYDSDIPTRKGPFGISQKGGQYNYITGNITIFGYENYNEYAKENPDLETFCGEFNHLLFSPSAHNSLGYSIQEAINHIITAEYNNIENWGINNTGYSSWKSCTYMLIELIGNEPFKEYYYGGGDIRIIINSLISAGLTLEEACEIIGEVDNMEYNINSILEEVINKNDGYYGMDDAQPAFDRFNELYTKAYCKKYSSSPATNPIIDAYYYSQTNDNCDTYNYLYDLKNKDLGECHFVNTFGESIVYPLYYFKEKSENDIIIGCTYSGINHDMVKETNFVIASSDNSNVYGGGNAANKKNN